MFTTFTQRLRGGCTFAASDVPFPTKDLKCLAVSPDPIAQIVPHLFHIQAESALPHDCHTPTGIAEVLDGSTITLSVASELRKPEVSSRRGHSKERTSVVVVPEATVHEDNRSPARQYDIWTARQLRTVKPVAETLAPQKIADLHFGPRVLAPDL